jgi:creatinine amidohydrolase
MAGGLALLRRRVEAIPGQLRAFRAEDVALPELGAAPLRAVVATGAGSSLEHARFLASLLAEGLGFPARCAAPSVLLEPPGPEARDALLVVFSQGLSPNGRAPLAHARAWRGALLVTSEDPAGGDAERAAALAALRAAGGRALELPVPRETGLLLRAIGPSLGLLAAIEVARAVARSQQLAAPWPELGGDALAAAVEDAAARGRALRASLPGDPLPGALALLAGGAAGAPGGSLARKLLEGLLVPLPPVWDPLDFAHGGFQQLFAGNATLLALLHPGSAADRELVGRVEAMLDASRHRLLRLEARLAAPHAALEHDAILNELLLGALEARGIDPGRWPGQGRDAPLYGLAAPPPPAEAPAGAAPRELARLAWPELDALLAAGARTALVPLGSTEQHGPHLPFATDTRVADALAERFCARVPEAVRLPALPFGCASEHLGFPGTLSLGPETLAALLEDLVASLDRHGFRHIVVFSAHGGNAAALRSAAPRLARAAERAQVTVCAEPGAVSAALFAAAAGFGVDARDAGHHAGEIETSMLLALAPGDVRSERAERGLTELPPDPQAAFYPDLREKAPSGVVGDPRPARAGRAAAYLDAWVDVLVEAYERAKKSACTNGTQKP